MNIYNFMYLELTNSKRIRAFPKDNLRITKFGNVDKCIETDNHVANCIIWIGRIEVASDGNQRTEI